MQGLHLTADLTHCRAPLELLNDALRLAPVCLDAVSASGLHCVGERFHQFPNASGEPKAGVTGLVLLTESHFAVHTWPEIRGVTLDIYVCNFAEDNSTKARSLLAALLELFAPGRAEVRSLQRGDITRQLLAS